VNILVIYIHMSSSSNFEKMQFGKKTHINSPCLAFWSLWLGRYGLKATKLFN